LTDLDQHIRMRHQVISGYLADASLLRRGKIIRCGRMLLYRCQISRGSRHGAGEACGQHHCGQFYVFFHKCPYVTHW
ncbi:hypothetical protein R0J91_16825, partial [Micrococcus sp. SIMBA_131]